MIRTSDPAPGVRRVCLDRPDARNAVRPADLDALARAVTAATTPVVVVTGAGSAFCAGADLGVVRDLADPAAFAAHGQRVARTIETAEPVVIAGVDGPARGGGVELALACDLRVATPDASFAESGIDHGLFGAWGGTHRLPAIVGPSLAADMLLSGRVVDAETAREAGLVSRVVEEPLAVARELAERPHDAVRRVRGLVGDDGSTRISQGVARSERAERAAFAELHAAHVAETGPEPDRDSNDHVSSSR
ncbi:enoyl-CoA hydratase/isomerase family protein [Halobaculum sp. MBLA0147]|uniref:enoyl-CoA hydratase/isomerase family protein n=1 Tax=Halobaculum sp. MBLA0147 TaxID=3079934 RepID=UPI003526241D